MTMIMEAEEAKSLGREAVEAGCMNRDWPCIGDCVVVDFGDYVERPPNFSNPWNALACIPWVEEVALKAYGIAVTMSFKRNQFGKTWTVILNRHVGGSRDQIFTASTLPRACVNAVKATLGSEQ